MRVTLYMPNPGKANGQETKPPQSHSLRWEAPEPTPKPDKTATYHALWHELHTKQDATPEWFADWLNRVPKTCGCDKSLKTILDELGQPDYTNWFAYSVRLHNLVNAKLKKPEVDLEAARQIWT